MTTTTHNMTERQAATLTRDNIHTATAELMTVREMVPAEWAEGLGIYVALHSLGYVRTALKEKNIAEAVSLMDESRRLVATVRADAAARIKAAMGA